ncbi:hypothetical protein [Planctomicrobium piriforme]|uniref:Soil-associated protein, TIGR03435 family n=1 Tax=Planctomicrobium piriforme TaxID=1576369 RepID=A0A1I3BDA0_9PLAN|nr:hypothetical protein [Planctomicrobium piriforme]SFH60273.1 hypothetical protein SAMN05421753_101391 [Planctomicrobium piriforme]
MSACRPIESVRLFSLAVACAALLRLVSQTATAGDAIRLAESYTDQRTYSTQSNITTSGKVLAAKGDGAKDELELAATVTFDFLSRRLPPAGRDAEALREVREFQAALLTTKVAGYETKVDLPENRQIIVVSGTREGLLSYSPQGQLTRETVDLLEIPGDSLSLLALLPLTEVRVGEEWLPADWVVQMLTGIEAVETSELKCRLDQATPTAAKVTFNGKIKGQKLGTNTTVTVIGALLFNLETQYLTQAKTIYTITSDVGTVNPGLDMKVTTVLSRKLADSPGELTDALLSRIPLEPSPEALGLKYLAGPWGLELSHSRDWHLFQAAYDGGAPVAILRLVEHGSLVAQCNFSPAPPAQTGAMTSLEKFEADIEQSLGERFGEVISRETIPLDDGRKVLRVAVSGNVVVKSVKGRADIPMNWIYYLVASPQGRQASFVFSVEPPLLEQLNNRDRELVLTLRFVPPTL